MYCCSFFFYLNTNVSSLVIFAHFPQHDHTYWGCSTNKYAMSEHCLKLLLCFLPFVIKWLNNNQLQAWEGDQLYKRSAFFCRRGSFAELDVLFAQISFVTAYLGTDALVATQQFLTHSLWKRLEKTGNENHISGYWKLRNILKGPWCIFERRALQMFVARFSRPVTLRTRCLNPSTGPAKCEI